MRIGRLPEGIYSRSVERIVHKYNKDIMKGAVLKRNCAFLCAKNICLETDSSCWEAELRMCMAELAVEAAVAGGPADPEEDPGIQMQAKIILPLDTEEPELRMLMEALTGAAGSYHIPICGADVRSDMGISRIFITCTLLGQIQDGISQMMAFGDRTEFPEKRKDIVMIGRTAASGTAYLAEKYKDLLAERYSSEYMRRMRETGSRFLNGMEPRIYYTGLAHILSYTASCVCTPAEGMIYASGEGGIFATLWNLGKAYGCGLRVKLKDIPVYQESIEVCDALDINPYMTYNGGSMVVTAADGATLAEELTAKGYEAACIGFLTDDHDRVIINGDEERYLTAPAVDEIYRYIAGSGTSENDQEE